jgi:PAS domain S-box-containing protein
MRVFEGFLESRYFESWASLHIGTIATLVSTGELTADMKTVPPSAKPSAVEATTQKSSSSLPKNALAPPKMSMARSALSHILETERKFIIENDYSWLPLLLSMAESLPLPFSVSSSDIRTPGFPLTYVNPAFEKLTGYTREEVIGKNCRFLQINNVTRESIYHKDSFELKNLQHALMGDQPSAHILTNFRKDGSLFYNYLCLKPVFDQYGHCRFVFGLQFEVSSTSFFREGKNESTLLNRNLLSLLPSMLYDPDVVRPAENT